MLGFLLRRVLHAVPSLLLFAIILFIAISLAPPTESPDAEQYTRRFWHLPLIVNVQPEDRPRIVEQIVQRLPNEIGEARERDMHRLFRMGAAALPDIVPALEKVDGSARARIARDLAPLAFRMGIDDVTMLEDPARAVSFWVRVLDDRGAELRPSSVRRALRRHLADRAEPLYARQLRNADTAILAPIFDELQTSDADSREALEDLAIAALRRAGSISVHDSASLRAYWAVHRAEYVEFGALERVAARITETRFGRWVIQAMTQRFGRSWRTGQPVLDDLSRRAPLTLARVAFGLLLAYAVALPLGMLTAARRGGPTDRVSQLFVLLIHAFPAFVVALLARSAWPRLARTDAFVAVALALVSLAPISRHIRSRLLEEARQDYVLTARAMGVSNVSLWASTIARNALGSIVAFAAVQIPLVLSATMLVEEILAIDGLGPAVIDAVRARDVPWLMAFGIAMAMLSTIVFLIADAVQAANDPRVRTSMFAERPEDA